MVLTMNVEDEYRDYCKEKLSQIKLSTELKEKTAEACKQTISKHNVNYRKPLLLACSLAFFIIFTTANINRLMPNKVNNNNEGINRTSMREVSPSVYDNSSNGKVIDELTYVEAGYELIVSKEPIIKDELRKSSLLYINYKSEENILIKISTDKKNNSEVIEELLNNTDSPYGSLYKKLCWKYSASKDLPIKEVLYINIYKEDGKTLIKHHSFSLEEIQGQFLIKNIN